MRDWILVLFCAATVLGEGLPPSGRPYEMIWQAPSGRCMTKWGHNFNLVNYKIEHNPRDEYSGPSNCIGYYFGQFTYQHLTTGEIVNGGVPQNGNMTFHLLDLIHEINQQNFLPVCDTEDGVCSRSLSCDWDWVCIEVPDWANETKWNYPEAVIHHTKKCKITDTNSPFLGSEVCGYDDQEDCVPINRDICERVDHSWHSKCTFNMEWWRPSWQTNWADHHAFYRTMSIDLLAAELYPDIPRPLNQSLVDLITLQAIPLFEEWATAYMVRSAEVAKMVRPNTKWGYYAYPYCYNSASPLLEECRQSTQDNNDWHSPIWAAADCLQPSVYMFYDMTREEAFTSHYAQYCEAVRSGFRDLGDDYVWPVDPAPFWADNDVPDGYWKCILPYTTYKHDIVLPAPNLYTDHELKITLRMGAYYGFPGSYIWGSSFEYVDFKDANGQSYNTLCPLMKEYTTNNIGPYAKQVVEWAERCSNARCSGQGRCAHRGALCDDFTKATEMFALDLDDFDTTDQTNLDTNYFCKCYDGWKGNKCDVAK